MDFSFSRLTHLFIEADKMCAELPLSVIKLHEKRIMHFSKAFFLERCFLFFFFSLLSKVDFTSLVSDDKLDLASLYIFESDSFPVSLAVFSSVLEPFFM